MNYLIVGASSGLGRDLAYTLSKNLCNLTLISRDKRDLDAMKSDLEYKYKIKINSYAVDLASKDSIISFLNDNEIELSTIDGVLFPIGMMSENDSVTQIKDEINQINNANFLSIVKFIEKIIPIFKEKQKGTIVGFGSMASSLGREKNMIYSASKRALNSYFESLSATFINSNINVQFYILGYLDTNLAFNKKLILPKASTKQLAIKVFKNIDKNNIKKYYPGWWGLISYFISLIPFFIIKKLFKFIK
jgi:short-subunit dehydrogenase|tara:strand:+ start:1950 stop:2693 length:744 start_codon:yes stop_codon:yes gene_type:complete